MPIANTIFSKDPKDEGEIFKKILVDIPNFGNREILLKTRQISIKIVETICDINQFSF
jgi:hypothetical protein